MQKKTRYDSFDPHCEVLGASMLAILRSINRSEFQHLIDRHKLNSIEANEWYLLQTWLDFLTDLKNEPNHTVNFTSIGLQIASQLPHQEEAKSYEEVLLNHPTLYHSTHRNGYDGDYSIEKMSDDHFVVTVKVPYPDDLVYGSLWGEANRYVPKDRLFSIGYDSSATRREFGGDTTVIYIKLR